MKPDAYSGEARLGRIRDKEAVINELSYVDPMTPSLGETVKKLRDKLYACGSCGHDDNIRLKNEFESAADRLFKERDRIREEFINNRGSQFDPEIVTAFLDIMGERNL